MCKYKLKLRYQTLFENRKSKFEISKILLCKESKERLKWIEKEFKSFIRQNKI